VCVCVRVRREEGERRARPPMHSRGAEQGPALPCAAAPLRTHPVTIPAAHGLLHATMGVAAAAIAAAAKVSWQATHHARASVATRALLISAATPALALALAALANALNLHRGSNALHARHWDAVGLLSHCYTGG
jgi:hypothetical protein